MPPAFLYRRHPEGARESAPRRMIGQWPSPFEARPSAERFRVTDYFFFARTSTPAHFSMILVISVKSEPGPFTAFAISHI
jgi:hypothetical protein